MNVGLCSYCGNSIYSDDDHASGSFSIYHIECKELNDDEMKTAMDAEWQANKQDQKNTDRILRNLKRKLKPKIWEAVNWEIQSHGFGHLKIVTVEQVSGEKRLGHEYFGQKTAMRHVYDNVSSDAHGDCYGGDVYLYIGSGRYLKVYVWG